MLTAKEKVTRLLCAETSTIWDIITALRGPDHNDSYEVKRATTAVIRYSVGIPPSNNFSCVSLKDDEEKVAIRVSLSTLEYNSPYWTTDHFYRHVLNAFWALGLTWNDVNK